MVLQYAFGFIWFYGQVYAIWQLRENTSFIVKIFFEQYTLLTSVSIGLASHKNKIAALTVYVVRIDMQKCQQIFKTQRQTLTLVCLSLFHLLLAFEIIYFVTCHRDSSSFLHWDWNGLYLNYVIAERLYGHFPPQKIEIKNRRLWNGYKCLIFESLPWISSASGWSYGKTDIGVLKQHFK